jgi:hypothetical protein
MSSDQIQELPLRLEVCPRCDYSLTGLAAVGVCPECGREYDQNTVVLYGNAAGSRRNAWSGGGQRSAGQWILTGCFACLYLALVIWGGRRRHVSIPQLFYVPMFFFSLGIALWRQMSDQGSGVVQVKMTPLGLRQGIRGMGPIPYERNDGAKLVPWSRIRKVQIKELGHGEVHLMIASYDHAWTFGVQYVNAKVRCTHEQTSALEVRISQWRRAAAAGDA